jgi:signal transduction histidine kinase
VIGEPRHTLFPLRVTLRFPPTAGPFEVVEVEHDRRPLFQRATRVFAIHFLVAIVLVAVYRVQTRALREALRGARDTYEQLLHAAKLSAIGEMYAGLTHEINNPLGIVLSGVRLLAKTARERDLSRAELIAELDTVDRHGSRIAELLRSLLAFGRRAPLELRTVSLNRVIDDALALVERPFAKQGIRIEHALDPSLPVIRGSHDHLVQVFVNLVNNSRDAMPGGGVIRVRTYRNGTGVVAEVSDTGTGIPSGIRDRLFEPFFTTKDVGKGTGLGLWVSYGIVQAHHGRIEMDPAQRDGALFRVTLPPEGMTA